MIILNNVTLIADHCNLEKLSKECCPYENGIEIHYSLFAYYTNNSNS